MCLVIGDANGENLHYKQSYPLKTAALITWKYECFNEEKIKASPNGQKSLKGLVLSQITATGGSHSSLQQCITLVALPSTGQRIYLLQQASNPPQPPLNLCQSHPNAATG